MQRNNGSNTFCKGNLSYERKRIAGYSACECAIQ